MATWRLDTEGTRELLLLLANTVREADAANPLAHTLLVRFLATYDGGSPAELMEKQGQLQGSLESIHSLAHVVGQLMASLTHACARGLVSIAGEMAED